MKAHILLKNEQNPKYSDYVEDTFNLIHFLRFFRNISCPTSSFSISGLFGEESSSSSSSTGTYLLNYNSTQTLNSTTDTTLNTVDELLNSEGVDDITLEEDFMEQLTNNVSTLTLFNKDLWTGVYEYDVFMLQKSLNREGFILAEMGPGSLGKETRYFGPRTRTALSDFQMVYKDAISGLSGTTGYLDYFTRDFIKTNFK